MTSIVPVSERNKFHCKFHLIWIFFFGEAFFVDDAIKAEHEHEKAVPKIPEHDREQERERDDREGA